MNYAHNTKEHIVMWQHSADDAKKASALMTLQQAVKAVIDLESMGYHSATIVTYKRAR